MKALTFPKGLALIAFVLLVVRRALWVETSKVALPPAAFPREAMAIVVSLVVLGASLFVILSKKYPPESDRWAYGTVGTIVGFWLA